MKKVTVRIIEIKPIKMKKLNGKYYLKKLKKSIKCVGYRDNYGNYYNKHFDKIKIII